MSKNLFEDRILRLLEIIPFEQKRVLGKQPGPMSLTLTKNFAVPGDW
jgi:hypothetical protein